MKEIAVAKVSSAKNSMPKRSGGISMAPIQGFFPSKEKEDMHVEYIGDKLEIQMSDLQPVVVGGIEYMVIDNLRGEVQQDAANYIFSNDMSLAVLDVTGKLRPKQFFAHPEIILKTNKVLSRQRSCLKLLPTGNTLVANAIKLLEVEAIPNEEGGVSEKTKRQNIFVNMPFRGASSDPTRYMFGYSSQVEHKTPLGIRFHGDIGQPVLVDDDNKANLAGVEGDVMGIRGLTKLFLNSDSSTLSDEQIRDQLKADMSFEENNDLERAYSDLYQNNRSSMDAVERRLGVNQYAQPRVGDSIVTFLKSTNKEDLAMFEQGNYHGGVMAESLDGQDYVTIELRRRMDLEVDQKRHYFRRMGLDVDRMSNLDINHNAGAIAAGMEEVEDLYFEYLEAKTLNVQPHQTGYYKMYGRSVGQTYHESKVGPYFDVPVPMTVVLSSPERDYEMDAPLPDYSKDASHSFWKHPDFKRKDIKRNEDARLEARIKFEDDSFIGLISVKSFKALFKGKSTRVAEHGSLQPIRQLINSYQKMSMSKDLSVLRDKAATLISMQKAIYRWHSEHPYFVGSSFDYEEYYAIMPPLFAYLDLVNMELDMVTGELNGEAFAGLGLGDESVRIWERLKNTSLFKSDLKGRVRDRLRTYFFQLLNFDFGRSLLTDVFLKAGKKVTLLERKDKSGERGYFEVIASSKSKSKAGAKGAGAGSDVKIIVPSEAYLSESAYWGEGDFDIDSDMTFKVNLLEPGVLRLAKALNDALLMMKGQWSDGFVLDSAPMRGGLGLPMATSPALRSKYVDEDLNGVLNYGLTEKSERAQDFDGWLIMSYA
ncbi:hypothetical protein AUTU_24540 [Aureibacter tunicatorum]|nr:hypothetical protein AUTU_24540 [Aureibacter tunicatorum]